MARGSIDRMNEMQRVSGHYQNKPHGLHKGKGKMGFRKNAGEFWSKGGPAYGVMKMFCWNRFYLFLPRVVCKDGAERRERTQGIFIMLSFVWLTNELTYKPYVVLYASLDYESHVYKNV